MTKTVDLIGKRFGRWLVLEISNMGKNPRVKVICDCGTEKIILSKTLVAKKAKSTSCGCYQRERVKECLGKPNDVSALNQYYSIYKTSAKQRNHNFNLTKYEFKQFIFEKCYYCEKNPEPRLIHSRGLLLNVNGIDRVDNSKGYSIENCVTCCKDCNNKKSDITKNIIIKAYNFLMGDNNA